VATVVGLLAAGHLTAEAVLLTGDQLPEVAAVAQVPVPEEVAAVAQVPVPEEVAVVAQVPVPEEVAAVAQVPVAASLARGSLPTEEGSLA
jgi:hypothetical protein